MINTDIHVWPQGCFNQTLLPATEFVDFPDRLAKLEPVWIVQVILKRCQSKWMMWCNAGNKLAVSTVIIAGFNLLQACISPVESLVGVVNCQAIGPAKVASHYSLPCRWVTIHACSLYLRVIAPVSPIDVSAKTNKQTNKQTYCKLETRKKLMARMQHGLQISLKR